MPIFHKLPEGIGVPLVAGAPIGSYQVVDEGKAPGFPENLDVPQRCVVGSAPMSVGRRVPAGDRIVVPGWRKPGCAIQMTEVAYLPLVQPICGGYRGLSALVPAAQDLRPSCPVFGVEEEALFLGTQSIDPF